jgi:hypothetical protein
MLFCGREILERECGMESVSCGRHVAEGNNVIDERRNASAMKIATADFENFGLNRETAR